MFSNLKEIEHKITDSNIFETWKIKMKENYKSHVKLKKINSKAQTRMNYQKHPIKKYHF